MLYVNSDSPGTTAPGITRVPSSLRTIISGMINSALISLGAIGGVSGSYSFAAVVQAVFTVTIGSTQTSTNYKVLLNPTSFTATVASYVTNKTLTTFDVTYIVPLTGAVSFDWLLVK